MAATKITIIGSGDAFGSGGRMSTCFYAETTGFNFLIDCGASAIPGIKQHQITLDSIDAILLTHFHGDHYGGLPFLLLEMAVYGRQKPITIVSPPGCCEKLDQLLKLLYPGTEVLGKLKIKFLEYQPWESVTAGPIKVTAFPVVHVQNALPHGLRIQVDDKIISYSGDTEWTENLIELSNNADLFICECNFFNFQVKGHLNYQILKEKLSMLSYKNILLTHLDNEMLSNLDKVEQQCAYDGLTINI